LALNIFRTAEEQNAQPKAQFADVVGSFRAGYLDDNKTPQSLNEWRVTTGDPVIADAVHELLGGEAPAEWETKSEEALEVYTAAKSITIVLEGPRAIRQQFIQRNRAGEVVYTSDGAMKSDGERDPHAQMTLDERLKLASDGLGPSLETVIWFHLDDSMGNVTIQGDVGRASDLGKFRYSSTGKSIGKQVDRDRIEQQLIDYAEDSETGEPVPVRAKLTIERVSFTAKTGARAGKLVEYNTAALKLLGPVR
jgi:hypothetical protein